MRIRRVLSTVLATTTVLATGIVLAHTADAATEVICGDTASVPRGDYIVMNNKWNKGATEKQCIEVADNGFRLSAQPNVLATNRFPAGYPAIYLGCHYTNCSANSPLPAAVSTIEEINSEITYEFTEGIYNASYDIWMDPEPRRDGVNKTEIMIWFNRVGQIQPVGEPTGTAELAGHEWEVWTGNNGQNNVITYLGAEPIETGEFNAMDFIADTFDRSPEYGNPDWFVTSIQAGFEPWEGAVDAAVTSFDVAVVGKTP